MRRTVKRSMIVGFPVEQIHLRKSSGGPANISVISIFLMGIIIVVAMLAVNLIDLPSALTFTALFLILILVIVFIDIRSR